jgi:DNA uptake protein ComE-like DNA-binding protein
VHQLQHQLAQLQHQQQSWQNQRQQYLQEHIMEFIKDQVHTPELEDELVRQVQAVRATNPRLFESGPMAVVKQAHSRALAIVPDADKSKAEEAKKKADEARRLGSLNVRSVLSKSPSNIEKDIWSSANWESAYDKANRR